jgi:hypothetical protein
VIRPLLPPVFQVLKASADVTSIVGTNPPRIWRHSSAPQRPDGLPLEQPYITWAAINGVPENNLSDPPPTDRVQVQVDCYHQTDKGIELLAQAVRDAMEMRWHMTSVLIDHREAETKLYRIAMQFDCWHDRGCEVP